jgi:hypothetical protein
VKPERVSRGSAWRPELSDSDSREFRVSTGEEIEITLAAAEGLLSEAQRDLRDRNRTPAWIACILAVALGAAIILTSSAAGLGAVAAAIAAGLLVASSSLVAAIATAQARAERRRPPVQMELAIQLAGMVREVYLDVARREEWSAMRVDATKLRLSAFPLVWRVDEASGRR